VVSVKVPDRFWLRLVLALLPVNLLFFAFHLSTWMRLTEDQLQLQSERQAVSLSSQLALLSARALDSHNEWLLPEHVQRFAELPGVVYARLLDTQGRVLAAKDLDEIGTLQAATPDQANEPILTYRKGQQSLRLDPYLSVWDPLAPRFTDFDTVSVAVPVQLGGQRYGQVLLGLDLKSAKQQRLECYQVLWLASALLSLVTILLLGLIARSFSRPILRVAHKAERLAEQWDSEVVATASATPPQSEVGLLSRALDQMSSSLHQLAERQRQQRRDLQRRVEDLLACVQRVEEGDLLVRCAASGQDEIGRLEIGFNRMVSRLVKTRQAELQARLDLEWTHEALQQGNKRLAELDRRKTDFLNTASHELRTPLTSIRAFAEIVLDNEEESCTSEEFLEMNQEFLDIILRESDRLGRLLHSLLDLSSIESGKIDWVFEELEVEGLVRSTVDACRSLLGEKEMQLKVEVQPGLRLCGARDPLIQVLTNLLSNAIKFTPRGGNIEVRARRGEEHVIIEVEDSGVGIAPEDQSKVFDSFQQAEDQPDTQAPKGSGLGLAIVKQIVETHGGSMKLTSQLGKGSCFSVRLPPTREENP
jgi:signal transduction histidine kinase